MHRARMVEPTSVSRVAVFMALVRSIVELWMLYDVASRFVLSCIIVLS